MSKFDETEVSHINEILCSDLVDDNDCDYCERGWRKGFTVCPCCQTWRPINFFEDDYKPLERCAHNQ